MTDKQRLDMLDSLKTDYRRGWILRESSSDRGLRLHVTSLAGASPTVREAIDKYLKERGKYATC